MWNMTLRVCLNRSVFLLFSLSRELSPFLLHEQVLSLLVSKLCILYLHSLYEFHVSCFLFSHFNSLPPASLSLLLHFNCDFHGYLTRSRLTRLRSNPLPVEKAFYICGWFLFYDSAVLAVKRDTKFLARYVKGIPFFNRRYTKSWKMVYKRLRGGRLRRINICWVPLPSPPPSPLPGCYVSITLGPAHKCCFSRVLNFHG